MAEDTDYTSEARTAPSRDTNLMENIAIPFSVTKTQQLIDHYQGENELARQTAKAMVDWHNAAEFDVVRATLVTGASGTAPKFRKRLTLFFQNVKMLIDLIFNKTYERVQMSTL